MKSIKIFLSIFIAGAGVLSCTNLHEKLRDSLEEGSSSVTAGGLLQSAYESMNDPYEGDVGKVFALTEHTTDETIGPTRGPDWDDNGVWRSMHAHTWNADHAFIRDTYRGLLQVQFAASSVLEKNPSAQQAAEARFIRALSMFTVLDNWDQVPFRGDLKDLTLLPETKKGTEAADFIISELTAALGDLPDGPAIKANKNAARALLMKAYLNKGVYANRASPNLEPSDLQQVITLADAVINSGSYTLDANYFDNFAPDNYSNPVKNKELIYVLENTPGLRGGNMRARWFQALHYNQKPGGWNGFATLSDFYNKFEATDKRRGGPYPGVTNVGGVNAGFLIGQQYDQNGTALNDRRGNPLVFTPEVALKETGNNLEITGIRVIKYPIDYNHEDPADNEYVIFRYADILLMKAEALLRTGDALTALTIVNTLRSARGASALASLSLDNMLDERGRELYWECWRRQDLIRFGKYLEPWQEKPAEGNDPKYLLFPIPNEQLAVNPNLEQNPGY